MSKADGNKKAGDTRRRGKGDVLRAEDIIPAKGGSKKTKTAKKKTSSSKKGAGPAKDMPAEPTDKGQKESEIPKFDLAEQILAEQRKVASARRKGPGKTVEPARKEQEAEPVDYLGEQPTPMALERQQIIADIVARDIERLCRGNT
jgi:hypothetical protein